MGRASKRKKAQRQAGQKPKPDAAAQEAMLKVLGGLQALVEENRGRRDREAAARWIWSGGAEPVPAEAPQWPDDSLGGRFFNGSFLRGAQKAPCLATAEIPDAVPGLDAQAVVDALFGAFAKHYRCELPGDADLLERIGQVHGDPLVNLVRVGAVKPADILPVGLRLLTALAKLCRSNSPSLL